MKANTILPKRIEISEPTKVVNNPGKGACGYYAFGWGLLSILRSEQEQKNKKHSLLRKKLEVYIKAYNASDRLPKIDETAFFNLIDSNTFGIENKDLSHPDALQFLSQINLLLRFVLVEQYRKNIEEALGAGTDPEKVTKLQAIALVSDGVGGLKGDKNAEKTDIFKLLPIPTRSKYHDRKKIKDSNLSDPERSYETQTDWQIYSMSRLCYRNRSWFEYFFSSKEREETTLPAAIEAGSPLDITLKAKEQEFHQAETSDLVLLANCFDVQLNVYRMWLKDPEPRGNADDYYPKVMEQEILDADVPSCSKQVYLYKDGNDIKYKKRDCNDKIVSGFIHDYLAPDVIESISENLFTPETAKKLVAVFRRPRIEIEHHPGHWVTRFYQKSTVFAKRFRSVLKHDYGIETTPVLDDRHTDDFERFMQNSRGYEIVRRKLPDDPLDRKKNVIYSHVSYTYKMTNDNGEVVVTDGHISEQYTVVQGNPPDNPADRTLNTIYCNARQHYSVIGDDDTFDVKKGCFPVLHEGIIPITKHLDKVSIFKEVTKAHPNVVKWSENDVKQMKRTQFDYWLEYYRAPREYAYDYNRYEIRNFESYINRGYEWQDWQENVCKFKYEMDWRKQSFKNRANDAIEGSPEKKLWEKSTALLEVLTKQLYQAAETDDFKHNWKEIRANFESVLSYVTLYQKMEASIALFQAKEKKYANDKLGTKEAKKKAAAEVAKNLVAVQKDQLVTFFGQDVDVMIGPLRNSNGLTTVTREYETIMSHARDNESMGHVNSGCCWMSDTKKEIKAIMDIGSNAVNEASEKLSTLRKMAMGQ